MKRKWIRTGKVSGVGEDACFQGRENTHAKNARQINQMREHRFYREYPAKGVANIGGEEGCFENLEVYCGMAYDKKESVASLCSDGADESLLVWNKETVAILKERKGDLKENQLLAVSYLWELCYDLLLAKDDNVSTSPGFEALGLRPN